jgi:hypothetical protein
MSVNNTPADGMTDQVPVSFSFGEFPVSINGVELHTEMSDPAAEAVGVGSATMTETSSCVLVQVFPLEMSHLNVYFPLINPDIGELLRLGEGRVAVLGPLIWVHMPVPIDGMLPTRFVLKTLQEST